MFAQFATSAKKYLTFSFSELAPGGLDYQMFKVPAQVGAIIDWTVVLSKKNMIRNQFSKKLIITVRESLVEMRLSTDAFYIGCVPSAC